MRLIELQQCELARVEALASALATMDPWQRLGISRGRLLNLYLSSAQDRLCRVVEVEGEVAGVLCLQYPWLRGVYIEQFGLLPPFQGRGLGAELLRRVEREYCDRTANLWLLVSAFNTGARRFYQRQGLVEIGPIKDFLLAGEDEILMRKVLRQG